MAPAPTSPQAKVEAAFGGTTVQPSSDVNTARCLLVKGCSHIAVFMAGATIHGFEPMGHARKMQVCREAAMHA